VYHVGGCEHFSSAVSSFRVWLRLYKWKWLMFWMELRGFEWFVVLLNGFEKELDLFYCRSCGNFICVEFLGETLKFLIEYGARCQLVDLYELFGHF